MLLISEARNGKDSLLKMFLMKSGFESRDFFGLNGLLESLIWIVSLNLR